MAKCSSIFKHILWEIWNGLVARWSQEGDKDRQWSFEEDLVRCKELTSLALGYGARIDECVISWSGENILFFESSGSDLCPHQWKQILQYLLQLGVALEHRDTHGHTPFLDAIQYCCSSNLISAYLAVGADLHAKDCYGHGYLYMTLWSLLRRSTPHSRDLTRQNIVILLKADVKVKNRVITPHETPMIRELAAKENVWELWMAVFKELEWGDEQMEVYRYSSLYRKEYPYMAEHERLRLMERASSRISEAKFVEILEELRLE